jgi:F1F0 ATPase subunit 2
MSGSATLFATLLAALAAGAAAGTAYFALLWWTVAGIATARRPALRVAGGMLARLAAAGAGAGLAAWLGGWQHLLAAAAGFTAARMAIVRWRLPGMPSEGTP